MRTAGEEFVERLRHVPRHRGQVADHHGTAHLAIDSDTQAVTKRYTTPFGAPRGTNPAWVDDKTFLGKPTDTTTGLTHIGAREYDPLIGRFISVDPVMNTTKPLSLNGYTYTENNPVTIADPTGLDGSCPYPSGSAQFKACNSYASSPNGMLTTKERKQRTEERRKQVRDENYNACRSGQGGCGGGRDLDPQKPKKKQSWWKSPNWNKIHGWVNTVSTVLTVAALITTLVVAYMTPLGWLATAIMAAAAIADGCAAVVNGIDSYGAFTSGDPTRGVTSGISAALSAVGGGAAGKAFQVARGADSTATRFAADNGKKVVYQREAQTLHRRSPEARGMHIKGRDLAYNDSYRNSMLNAAHFEGVSTVASTHGLVWSNGISSPFAPNPWD